MIFSPNCFYVAKRGLIVLDGPDGAGKTTLACALRRHFNHFPVVLDRFLVSDDVYDEMYGRPHRRGRAHEWDALRSAFEVAVIVCVADPLELYERVRLRDVGLATAHETLDAYQTQVRLYRAWADGQPPFGRVAERCVLLPRLLLFNTSRAHEADLALTKARHVAELVSWINSRLPASATDRETNRRVNDAANVNSLR